MDLVKHVKAYGTSILAVGLAIAAITVGPSSSFAQRNSIEQYSGIWEVDEIGSGIFMSDRKGFWEIKQEGGSLNILTPNDNLTFYNVVPQDFKIRASEERSAKDGNYLEKYTLDILFSEVGFRGRLVTPRANYEVTGELTKTSRQYRKELARLRKINNLAGSQINELTRKNDILENNFNNQQGDLETAKQALRTNKDLLSKSNKNFISTKRKFEAQIKAIKNAAPQIDVKLLQSSYRVRFETELKVEPRKKARSYLKLSVGEPVIILVEIPRKDWAFIATSKGKLGYVQTKLLIVSSNVTSAPLTISPIKIPKGTSKLPGNKAIVILEPRWDPGQEGSRMTVAAAGFFTLSGAVKTSQRVQSLKINQKPVPISSDGSFQTFLNISSSQRIEIVAVLMNGRSEKLTFNMVVRSP